MAGQHDVHRFPEKCWQPTGGNWVNYTNHYPMFYWYGNHVCIQRYSSCTFRLLPGTFVLKLYPKMSFKCLPPRHGPHKLTILYSILPRISSLNLYNKEPTTKQGLPKMFISRTLNKGSTPNAGSHKEYRLCTSLIKGPPPRQGLIKNTVSVPL